MDIDLSEIIIELIKVAENSNKINPEIRKDHSFSESFPEGKIAYFKKRAHEIRKKIYDDTLIGRKWVEDKCQLDILQTDWMGRVMTVYANNRIMKYYAWGDLRIFVERILQLLLYEDIIKKAEVIPGIVGAIHDTDHLALIYKKYKHEFQEPKEVWISRFYRNGTPVDPINISQKATEGSNKLILIAILSSISKTTGNAFCYSKFVQERFGILNFDKTVSDHKEKQTFKETVKDCNAILKIGNLI